MAEFDFSGLEDIEAPSTEFDFGGLEAVPAIAPIVEDSAPDFNLLRGFTERIADLAGGFIGVASDITDAGMGLFSEDSFIHGGFAWEEGDILPTFLDADKWREFERIKRGGEGFFKTLETNLKDFDAGYMPQATWDTVKDEFESEGLSTSAMGELISYGFETGVMSIPDMANMVFNLPAYVVSRAGEIGDTRAKNSGRDEGDLVDTLEAFPVALGSALFDKFGLGTMLKPLGIGGKGPLGLGDQGIASAQEQLGKEILEHGLGKVVLFNTGKAIAVESATEAFQEGVIEYIGERIGTDAAMSWKEAADRAAGAAVAGGMFGGAAGGTTTAIQGAVVRNDALGQLQNEIVRDDTTPEVGGDALNQLQAQLEVKRVRTSNDTFKNFTSNDFADFLQDKTFVGPIEEAAVPDIITTPETDVFDYKGLEEIKAKSAEETEGVVRTAEEVIRVGASKRRKAEKAKPIIVPETVKKKPQPQRLKETEKRIQEEEKVLAAKKETPRREAQYGIQKEPSKEGIAADIAIERGKKARKPFTQAAVESRKKAAKIKKDFDAAAKVTNVTPTPQQIAAGNYKKGKAKFQDIPIRLENPKGSFRQGVDESGKKWKTKLKDHYGEIEGTKDRDGDPIDAFIGPKFESDRVFVIDQIVPKTGAFDEHKVVFGAETKAEAESIYSRNYAKGWKGKGDVIEMSMEDFKEWSSDPKNTQTPIASNLKAVESQAKQSLQSMRERHIALKYEPEQDFAAHKDFKESFIDEDGERGFIKRIGTVAAKEVKKEWDQIHKRRAMVEELKRCLVK